MSSVLLWTVEGSDVQDCSDAVSCVEVFNPEGAVDVFEETARGDKPFEVKTACSPQRRACRPRSPSAATARGRRGRSRAGRVLLRSDVIER